MLKIKYVMFKEPKNLLGKALKIYMKDGGAFYFRCTGAGVDHITGYDDTSVELRIDIEDIEYILGG